MKVYSDCALMYDEQHIVKSFQDSSCYCPPCLKFIREIDRSKSVKLRKHKNIILIIFILIATEIKYFVFIICNESLYT